MADPKASQVTSHHSLSSLLRTKGSFFSSTRFLAVSRSRLASSYRLLSRLARLALYNRSTRSAGAAPALSEVRPQ